MLIKQYKIPIKNHNFYAYTTISIQTTKFIFNFFFPILTHLYSSPAPGSGNIFSELYCEGYISFGRWQPYQRYDVS